MKKIISLLFFAVLTLSGAEVLENGSFETPSDKVPNRAWQCFPAKGWSVYIHKPEEKVSDCKVITGDAADGDRAVRLISRGKTGQASLQYETKIPAAPGDKIFVEAMMRGTGRAYFRIFWNDSNGKPQKEYFMYGVRVTPEWKLYKTNVEVPAGAVSFSLYVQVLVSDAEVDVDMVKCSVETGTVLDNGKVKAVLNPRLGGGIDSLKLSGGTLDYTRPNQMGDTGGMFNCIVPAKRAPGELRFAPAEAKVIESRRKIEMTQRIESGKLAGLEVVRTFELPPDSTRILVKLQMRNTGKAPMEADLRFQSVASSANGSFTWPTPDWIQVFHQDGKPLNSMNSVVIDLLRDGWMARSYRDSKTALLYTYDIKKSTRAYNYLKPDFVTMEWYYRPVTLAPGAVWQTEAAVEILPECPDLYIDAVARKNNHRLEEIKPMVMPPPPEGEPLPEIFNEFFPCNVGLGNLIVPEMAGLNKRMEFYHMHRFTTMRAARFTAENYATTFGGVHLVIDEFHKHLFRTPDGKHEFGEFIRKHRLAFSLGRMMYHRRDTDVKEYKKRLPEIIAVWKAPNLQKFVHAYSDRLLYINTGDEPIAPNIDVVMAAHGELKKWMPKGAAIFTILNSHTVEMMPYMPVYYGDFYPIKRKSSSGANPWSVYPEMADKVRRAGNKPVWFMPQVFAGGEPHGYDIYAYPTDGEIRLMFNLSIAAGVRGVSWYAFPHTGWSWVFKYFHLRYAPLNGSSMPGPGWDAVVDGFREMAGTGMLLIHSRPADLPAGCTLECGKYTDPDGFYNGPAAKLFALKSPKGMVVTAVNHNPVSPEKVTVNLPGGTWDLTALKPLEGTKVTRILPPGGAVYFYLGKDDGEIDAVHHGRYRAEAVRYLIAAKRAEGNGIPVIDPWKFDKLPGRKALAELNREFAALDSRIAAAPLGEAMKLIRGMREYLGKNDFELTRNIEFIITPEMYAATKKYQRYVADPDAKFQALKDEVIKDFRDVNRLTDYLDRGEKAADALPELRALDARVRKNMSALLSAVAERRKGARPDDMRK